MSAEDSKNVDKIKTEVKNGVLQIYVEKGMWNSWNWGNKKIKAYVTITDLKSLDLSGGSISKITDAISVNNLKLDLSGGSIVEGNISGNNLNIDLHGGSIATLDGSFTGAIVDASGGSILKAYDTNLSSCKVEASGGSIINITINKELSAEASGGSIINYKGDGVIKSVDASGGSIIKKKDS